MVKYHINPETGEAGACNANASNPKSTGCKYAKNGETPLHYNTDEEARNAYEKLQEATTFITLEKNTNTDGQLSAEKSTLYAQWSNLNEHLHNGTEVGNEAELYYYSSPAGMLELKRRMSEELEYGLGVHHEIFEKLKTYTPQLSLSAEEQEKHNLNLQNGMSKVEAANEQKDYIDFEIYDRVDRDIGAYLIEQSSNWLKKLTPQEQETVSQSTSSGFYLVEQANKEEVSRETKQLFANHPKIRKLKENLRKSNSRKAQVEILEQENKLLKSEAKKFTTSLKKAVANAPKLNTPVKTYRGMKIHEFDTMFETDKAGRHETVKKLLSGELNGSLLNKKHSDGTVSKLAHAPISTTMNPRRALGFSEADFNPDPTTGLSLAYEFLYEIEAKTMATPVAVSAWGSSEAEIFTNHKSDYELAGAYEQKQDRDHFIVIKLKERLS